MFRYYLTHFIELDNIIGLLVCISKKTDSVDEKMNYNREKCLSSDLNTYKEKLENSSILLAAVNISKLIFNYRFLDKVKQYVTCSGCLLVKFGFTVITIVYVIIMYIM